MNDRLSSLLCSILDMPSIRIKHSAPLNLDSNEHSLIRKGKPQTSSLRKLRTSTLTEFCGCPSSQPTYYAAADASAVHCPPQAAVLE